MVQKLLSYILISFATFVLSFTTVLAVSGFDMSTITETQLSNLYAAGQNITITAPFTEDVFVMGTSVVIDSHVKGDLFIAAVTARVSGQIDGDLRTVVRNLNLSNAHIGGEILAISQDFGMDQASTGSGNLLISSGNMHLFGRIQAKRVDLTSDAMIVGNEISVTESGSVLRAENLEFTPDFSWNGDIALETGLMKNYDAGKIKGTVETRKFVRADTSFSIIDYLGVVALLTLTSFILGLLYILFIRESLVLKLDYVKNKLIATFFSGFAFVVFVPLVTFLLLIMGVGFFVSLVLMTFYFFVIFSGTSISALVLGNRLVKGTLKDNAESVKALIIGSVILAILMALPKFGMIFVFLSTVYGVGFLLVSEKKYIGLFPRK